MAMLLEGSVSEAKASLLPDPVVQANERVSWDQS